MELAIFFEALPEAVLKPGSLLSGVSRHTHVFPDYTQAEIALFGVPDFRGAGKGIRPGSSLQPIREQFYALSGFSRPCRIADLGNLIPGNTLDETYHRLAAVCETLLSANVMPVMIGGSHDLDIGQFMAYESLEKLVTILNVDACIDLYAEEEGLPDQHHIHQILTHQPNYLFEYSHLAYQRFLTDPDVLETLQKINYELKSVGQIRDNMQEIEPQIRLADLMSFDIHALRASDGMANPHAHPFGLSGDEACLICWYAGTNEKLSSAGFYGYDDACDVRQHSAAVIATMLWYFVEGFCHRKQEYSFKSSFHTKYIVPMNLNKHPESFHGDELIFYKSKLSEKWWMEVSLEGFKGERYSRNLIIPCSYADYEQACQGIIPDRWFKALEKLV
jgi:formiminoglutamase